ncbi:MAG TPA: AfsA-related hotdog domain-containing protein, partial [Streptomyces sp.]
MSGDCVGPTPLPLLPPGTDLTFDRTVPRALVHRRQIAEVFVADSVQTSPDDFYLSFQVPRAYPLWSDQRTGYHDPLASVEAARQALSVVLHRHAGVVAGSPVTLRRISVRVEDPEAYAADGATPLQG